MPALPGANGSDGPSSADQGQAGGNEETSGPKLDSNV